LFNSGGLGISVWPAGEKKTYRNAQYIGLRHLHFPNEKGEEGLSADERLPINYNKMEYAVRILQ
jgi:hypothetical protein